MLSLKPANASDELALIEQGREAIAIEMAGLKQLSERLDSHFAAAVHLLLNGTGRVIVTGIGKSGYIGRKLAATFASTGSPAFFLHPAEAKHGDAGSITADDIVIAISYSGESEEVLALLPVLQRKKVTLISLTGNPASTLGKCANVHLNVHVSKEACPLNLAPTASTTATLAMGDALAVVLLNCRQFTAEHFALSHPGGNLGKRLLLTAQQVMVTGAAMPKVTPDVLLKNAIMEMTQKKLGMTTIVNAQDQLLGIFTDGDLRRVFSQEFDIGKTTIEKVMTKNPKTISNQAMAVDALEMMKQHKITALVVTDQDNRVCGVIHMHDLLRVGLN